mgnify:CR=1 FL=1
MIKIKILSYIGDYSDEFDRNILHDVTTWDEVTPEDFQKLVSWVMWKNKDALVYGERYIIFRQDNHNYKNCVNDYLKHIKEEEEKAAEAKRKREENKRLKKAKAKKLQEEDERRLLKELSEKYKD